MQESQHHAQASAAGSRVPLHTGSIASFSLTGPGASLAARASTAHFWLELPPPATDQPLTMLSAAKLLQARTQVPARVMPCRHALAVAPSVQQILYVTTARVERKTAPWSRQHPICMPLCAAPPSPPS